MATFTTEEKNFGQAFLDDIVQWISDNLDPDEIFPHYHLADWTRENLEPEGVFTYEQLALWAEKNDFALVD